jgi:hypothetical protein
VTRTKAPGGMPKVLYVRCDEATQDRLERARLQLVRDTGVNVSTADAVRVLLDEAMTERGVP